MYAVAAIAFARGGFHTTTIEDGDAAMARLDSAEILQRDARGGGAGALQAERLAEADLGHVDACALCSVGHGEQPSRKALACGVEAMACPALRHFSDQRVRILEEHALKDRTAFAFGSQGGRA